MNSSPSRQVWLNELIMTEIYTALLNMPNGKEELKRCLILNRYGSQTVCTVLHRDLTDANLQKMWGRGCGLVSLSALDVSVDSGLIAKITESVRPICT
jgi:hypothetical protein